MSVEDVKTVAVVGAGMMGSQIAEIFARSMRCRVMLCDVVDSALASGLDSIAARLQSHFVTKGKMTPQEKVEIENLIIGTTHVPEATCEADFVVEAIAEDLALKKSVFDVIDRHAPPHAVLASNTSYQNITEIASGTCRPEKIAGMHFFNPVAVMKLVEVVRGARTSAETVAFIVTLAQRLGKEPIVCRDTSYGFLANRAYSALVNETVQMVWERVATPEEIDRALKLGYNLPMGPLELMDYIGGWQIAASSEQDAIRELGPEKGRLHPLVRMMRRAGCSKLYDFWNEMLTKE